MTLFPEYGDFKISDIITQKFHSGSEDQTRLVDCQSQIEDVLRQKGYITTGKFNLLVTLTNKGRETRKYIMDNMNKDEPFTSQCDRVLRYITLKENKGKGLTTKEVSEALYIDVDTVQLIAEKFYKQGLILLSSTNGFYHFHVKTEAELFARETSFEEQKNRAYHPGHPVTNITIPGHGNIVNFGTLVDNVITNTIKISEQGNGDIATALQSLAKAVAGANEIAEEDKKDYLEQINTLSEQALLPEDQRLPKSTLKPIINYSLTALSAFASVSDIWATFGNQIKAFFLPGS